jgi:ribosomal protein S8E
VRASEVLPLGSFEKAGAESPADNSAEDEAKKKTAAMAGAAKVAKQASIAGRAAAIKAMSKIPAEGKAATVSSVTKHTVVESEAAVAGMMTRSRASAKGGT